MSRVKKGASRAITAMLLAFCLSFSMIGTAFAAERPTDEEIEEAKAQVAAALAEAAEEAAKYYNENDGQAYLIAAAEALVDAKPYLEVAKQWVNDATMAEELRAELLVELDLVASTIDEIAEVLNSPELETMDQAALDKLATLLPTLEEHAVNVMEIIALVDQYGLPEEIQAEIDALKAELKELKDQAIAEGDAFVQAKIAEIEAMIGELEDLLAEIEDCVEAEVEALKAEIEAQIDEIEAALNELAEQVEAEIAAKIAEIEQAVTELEAEVAAWIEEAKGVVEETYNKVMAAIEDIASMVESAFEGLQNLTEATLWDATHGELVLDDVTTVVALGDSNAFGGNLAKGEKTYNDLLGEALGVEVDDLSLEGMRAEDLHYLLDEAYELDAYGKDVVFKGIEDIAAMRGDFDEAISAADLITLSIGSDSLSTFAVNQAVEPVSLNWAAYVGEENAQYVEQALAAINAGLLEAGLNETEAALVAPVIEAYAYAYLGFCCNYAVVIDHIQEVNPDAEIVLVGLYNGLDSLVVEGVELGQYIEYFVNLIDAQFTVYAAANADDVTFVQVRDAQTDADAITGEDIEELVKAFANGDDLRANAAGHAYIAEQILNSLAIVEVAADAVYTSEAVTPVVNVTVNGQAVEAAVSGNGVEVGEAIATVTYGEYGIVEVPYEVAHLATADSFVDFEADAWYLEEGQGSFAGQRTLFMDYALATGLMSGYVNREDGTITHFGAWDGLDRAQAATIIYRNAHDDYSATTDASKYEDNATAMADVEDGEYYTAAVNWCVENGIITGYLEGPNAGKFMPYNKVTRQELAAMVQRYCVNVCGAEAVSADVSGYDDSSEIDAAWALPGLEYCKAAGIMTGVHGTNDLNPAGTANRAEAAKMFSVMSRDILWL